MYHRLARTERYRWWKPLVELGLVVLFLFLLSIVVLLPVFVLLAARTTAHSASSRSG